MATETPRGLMISKADIAMFATRHPSARLALHIIGVATAVLEQDDLFVAFQSASHGVNEVGRESAHHPLLLTQTLYVHDLNIGQLHILVALREGDVAISPLSGIMVGLETWRCCAEKSFCAKGTGEDKSCITGIVAR